MKKNTKGFMLVEFLVVSIFVLGTLIFLTVQFNNINKSYNRSFKYDTVSNLYSAKNIRKMIINDSYNSFIEELKNNPYVDFSNCNVNYFNSRDYCRALLENENVKTALFVSHDLTAFKNSNYYKQEISEGLRNYINTLKSSSNSYLIILEFNDKTFSSLKVN
ncbi:MAG: hypothetical protein IJ134_02665 [Bacilli bacterium]|nr:hypothetical protein [Bacilli bacterium]